MDEKQRLLPAVSPNFPLVGQANFIVPSNSMSLQSIVTGQNVAMSSTVFNDLGAHIGSVYRVKTLDGRFVPIRVAAEIQEDGVFHTTLGIGSGLVALIIAATCIVTMLVAMLVAWGAVRVRPLDVLRYE